MNFKIRYGVLVIILLSLVLISCTDSTETIPANVQSIEELEIPEGFDWDFTKTVTARITAEDENGDPVNGVSVALYKTTDNLAFEAATNPMGELTTSITMPETATSVYLDFGEGMVSVPISGDEINYTYVTTSGTRIGRPSSGTLYVPGVNSVVTQLFEDNWPNKGDYDFNDMVVETWGRLRYNQDHLDELEFEATVIASGATFNNGFEIMFQTDAFPNTAMGDIITFSAEYSDGTPLGLTSSEVYDAYGTDVIWDTYNSQMKLRFFENVYDVIPLPLGYLASNTFNEAPWVEPITINITIDYNLEGYGGSQHLIPFDPSDPCLNLNEYIPYVVKDGISGYEIHLPGDPYTAQFTQFGLFGTGDDNTPPTGMASPDYEDLAFKTEDGFSWGLRLEGILEHPREKADVVLAYPELADYFAGTQSIFDNWWQPHPDPDYSEGYILDRQDMTVADQDAPVGE